MTAAMQPFTIAVPDSKLESIRHRLATTTFTYSPDDDANRRYGIDLVYLRDFVNYWHRGYNWRAAGRELNRYPQCRCSIDGLDIHFVHVRRPNHAPRATLVFTHGWPGSTHEFHLAAERLAFPERFGGDPALGFDLVIPSLQRLLVEHPGIARSGLQGGDIGSAVSGWLASDWPQHVEGLHMNLCMPPRRTHIESDEAEWRAAVHERILLDGAYWLEHATRPQTIATALADHPVGYAAWVLEKFHGWGATGGDLESRFDRDWSITNLMIHLVNDASTSMIWMYHASAEDANSGDQFKVQVPTAGAIFAADWLPWPSRAIAERYYAISRRRDMPSGGHFAALEEPERFSDDVAEFFNGVLQ